MVKNGILSFPCLLLAELVYIKQTQQMSEFSHQVETSTCTASNWKRQRANLSRLVVIAVLGLISAH